MIFVPTKREVGGERLSPQPLEVVGKLHVAFRSGMDVNGSEEKNLRRNPSRTARRTDMRHSQKLAVESCGPLAVIWTNTSIVGL
jgi:hypothetical protein